MSGHPHCPACAAYDRWVEALVRRRAPLDLPGAADLAERVGYNYASTLALLTPWRITPTVIDDGRVRACSAFRGAILDDAAYRMTVLTCGMPPAPEQLRLRDGTLGVRDRARYLLVEGALDQLALCLIEAGVVPSLRA